VRDTTITFFSICAKSNILISFCSLFDNSSNLSSSFKAGKSEFSRFKTLVHILDRLEDIFGKIVSVS
jgi:hypothetical protein